MSLILSQNYAISAWNSRVEGETALTQTWTLGVLNTRARESYLQEHGSKEDGSRSTQRDWQAFSRDLELWNEYYAIKSPWQFWGTNTRKHSLSPSALHIRKSAWKGISLALWDSWHVTLEKAKVHVRSMLWWACPRRMWIATNLHEYYKEYVRALLLLMLSWSVGLMVIIAKTAEMAQRSWLGCLSDPGWVDIWLGTGVNARCRLLILGISCLQSISF